MKFIIGGVAYDAIESVSKASLGDLRSLNKHGVNIPTINAMFQRMADTTDFTTLLADDLFLDNIIGLVFLAKRKAGEDVTFEQASQVSFNDFSFEDDEVVEADPKAPSVPVADLAEPTLTP